MRPALDPASIKEAYFQRISRAHPDRQGLDGPEGQADEAAAKLNAAFKTLSEPSSRLRHLLDLLGIPLQKNPPANLTDLYFELAGILRETDLALVSVPKNTSPLLKVRLFSKVQETQDRLDSMNQRIVEIQTLALQSLQDLDAQWPPDFPPSTTPMQLQQLQEVYTTLSYTSKWLAQIAERKSAALQLLLASD